MLLTKKNKTQNVHANSHFNASKPDRSNYAAMLAAS